MRFNENQRGWIKHNIEGYDPYNGEELTFDYIKIDGLYYDWDYIYPLAKEHCIKYGEACPMFNWLAKNNLRNIHRHYAASTSSQEFKDGELMKHLKGLIK